MQVYATLAIHLLSSASLGATTDGPAAREPLWLDTSAGTSTQCASKPHILACQLAPPIRGSMDSADITNFIFIDISNSYKAAASRRAALWAWWLLHETVL
ncbi:hypothetical protein MRX96_028017 [Rhipicephalus microplus]